MALNWPWQPGVITCSAVAEETERASRAERRRATRYSNAGTARGTGVPASRRSRDARNAMRNRFPGGCCINPQFFELEKNESHNALNSEKKAATIAFSFLSCRRLNLNLRTPNADPPPFGIGIFWVLVWVWVRASESEWDTSKQHTRALLIEHGGATYSYKTSHKHKQRRGRQEQEQEPPSIHPASGLSTLNLGLLCLSLRRSLDARDRLEVPPRPFPLAVHSSIAVLEAFPRPRRSRRTSSSQSPELGGSFTRTDLAPSSNPYCRSERAER